MTRSPRVHYRGPLACKRFGVTTEYQSEVTCLHCRRRIQAWWKGKLGKTHQNVLVFLKGDAP